MANGLKFNNWECDKMSRRDVILVELKGLRFKKVPLGT